MEQNDQKYIYYGAGEYAKTYFEDFRAEYEPLCFCDRSATPGKLLCGLPVLPPSAMLDKYPNASIVITLHPTSNKPIVQTYLTEEIGVPTERIANYEAYEKAPSCWHLNNYVQLRGDCFVLCCSLGDANPAPTVYFNGSDTPSQKVAKLVDFRNSIKTALKKGDICACTGCSHLETRWRRASSLLEMVEPAFNNTCNLRCVYCDQTELMKEQQGFDAEAVLSTIRAMKEANAVNHETIIQIAWGEITMHPDRQAILSACNGMRTHVLSNCVVYDDALEQHLKLGKSVLNCSVDAGTRETCTRIKGADCFDRVCNNLKRYSLHTRIELKYIFLEGENDGDNDINGFISLVSNIRPYIVILARDTLKDTSKTSVLSNHALTQMARMAKGVKALGIDYRLDGERFRKEEEERFYNLI